MLLKNGKYTRELVNLEPINHDGKLYIIEFKETLIYFEQFFNSVDIRVAT